MSRPVRTVSIAGTLALAALGGMALAFFLPQAASTSAGETRTIHLTVREMAYYLQGRDDPNPTLHLWPGERVRIVISNHDAGMKHDFGVDAWQARSRLVDDGGEARVEVVAPATSGDAVYSCTPHGAMMHGTIRVE